MQENKIQRHSLQEELLLDRKLYTPLPEDLDKLLLQSEENKKIPCVLISTGSYCPVHQGHINQMITASKFLEENTNYFVLCSYISPSSDQWVNFKSIRDGFQEYSISFQERCDLIDINLKNRNIKNILVDKWEGSHTEFISFKFVCMHLDQYLKQINPRIQVFLCQGSDMLKSDFNQQRQNLSYKNQKININLIIVERNDEKNNQIQKVKEKMEQYKQIDIQKMCEDGAFFVKSEGNLTSSSYIRDLIQKGYNQQERDKIKDIIDLEVLDRIQIIFQNNQQQIKN